VGNIVALEHVNVTVPDQGKAALFYVNGLGLTRDPLHDDRSGQHVGRAAKQFHLNKHRQVVGSRGSPAAISFNSGSLYGLDV